MYLINCEFKLEFNDNYTPHIKTMYADNTHNFNMKSYLLYWIDYFMLRGYTFCNTNQMNIKTISGRCNITNKHYLKQPMFMCERKLNINNAKNPYLINSLNRFHNRPLMKKYSHIPFNN